MEKRINQRFEQYIGQFKDAIKSKVVELGLGQQEKSQELVEFVYEYERFILQKDDLNKRKRVKNSIPQENRCNAIRANSERCTRKRKDGHEFCGTHLKGTPNGAIGQFTPSEGVFKKIEVTVIEIDGIMYYIDTFDNIYKPEDIISGKENPTIIGKQLNINGVLSTAIYASLK
jgi:hypothetical protein